MFAVPSDEIGVMVSRSPAAAEQFASRDGHKVQGSDRRSDVGPATQRVVVEAFLAASRNGELDGLDRVVHIAMLAATDTIDDLDGALYE
jgi:hypothetical protein